MGLGSGIRDPEKTYSGSQIQRSKRHQIPDPDPQHCLKEIGHLNHEKKNCLFIINIYNIVNTALVDKS
jgi:hypothetical protein